MDEIEQPAARAAAVDSAMPSRMYPTPEIIWKDSARLIVLPENVAQLPTRMLSSTTESMMRIHRWSPSKRTE